MLRTVFLLGVLGMSTLLAGVTARPDDPNNKKDSPKAARLEPSDIPSQRKNKVDHEAEAAKIELKYKGKRVLFRGYVTTVGNDYERKTHLFQLTAHYLHNYGGDLDPEPATTLPVLVYMEGSSRPLYEAYKKLGKDQWLEVELEGTFDRVPTPRWS